MLRRHARPSDAHDVLGLVAELESRDPYTPVHLAGDTEYDVLVWSLAYPNYAQPLPNQYDCICPRNECGWFGFNLGQICVSERTSVTARIAVACSKGIGLLRFGTLSVLMDEDGPQVDFHMDLEETNLRMKSLRADGSFVLVFMTFKLFRAHFSDSSDRLVSKQDSTPNRWNTACFPLARVGAVVADQTRDSEGQLSALQPWVASADEPIKASAKRSKTKDPYLR